MTTIENRETCQRGIVLPVVLIMLIIMLLLGVAVIRNVTLEERMAGNMRDQQIAFQAAEDALRQCEIVVLQSSAPFYSAQPETFLGNGDPDPRNWENEARWSDATYAMSVPMRSGDMWAANSQCMVEKLVIFGAIPGQPPMQVFRVTGRGIGRNSSTAVMLQTNFRF